MHPSQPPMFREFPQQNSPVVPNLTIQKLPSGFIQLLLATNRYHRLVNSSENAPPAGKTLNIGTIQFHSAAMGTTQLLR